VNFAVGRTV